MTERGWIEGYGGVRLRTYDFGGTGPGILLIHGLMGRGTLWADVAQWLTQYGHVVSYDQRGHGQSDKPPGPYTRQSFVADAARVLEGYALAPALVIGWSMGAGNAWVLASRNPDLVRGLVIEDMYFKGHERDDRSDFRTWLQSWPVPFETVRQARKYFDGGQEDYAGLNYGIGGLGTYYCESLAEGPDGWSPVFDREHIAACRQDWKTNSYAGDLTKVRCPTLVIRGAAGTDTSREEFLEMVELVPDASLVEIEGATHHVHDDRPAEFRKAVEQFMSKRLGLGDQ